MSKPRHTSVGEEFGLSEPDIRAVRASFEAGTADWALFGYATHDDPRCSLRLLRTGLSSVDGTVQGNLDPESVTFGVFKAPSVGVLGAAADATLSSGVLESKDASDGTVLGAPDGPVVSFGFFGESLHRDPCLSWR